MQGVVGEASSCEKVVEVLVLGTQQGEEVLDMEVELLRATLNPKRIEMEMYINCY